MDQFEAYFRRADLDQDGRISGVEAVAFLKGSNLPQPVLAQVASIYLTMYFSFCCCYLNVYSCTCA